MKNENFLIMIKLAILLATINITFTHGGKYYKSGCDENKPVCGEDNKTYRNACQC